jgi:pimeloyl-ACP methyl ester carboxylesterase
MTEVPVRTAAANGTTLAFKDLGPGFPLVMINGFASPMDTWNPPLLAGLARAFRVIVFDNRGTGYSAASAGPFSIPLFADDTVALMDTLGIGRAHVLGLSMGASVAQELALAHPERVERLVLVAGTCGGKEMVRMRPETWAALADRSGGPAELADRMFSVLFTREWLATHDPWKYCPEVQETTSEDNAARQAEAFFSWPGSYDRLPGIHSPTLIVTGTDDAVIPQENSRILAARIPGARLAKFPGAGHGLQYQCPGAFTRAVLEFLRPGAG